MKRATRYAKRLRRGPVVGILLIDGSIVAVPLRPTGLARGLKRTLTRPAGRA